MSLLYIRIITFCSYAPITNHMVYRVYSTKIYAKLIQLVSDDDHVLVPSPDKNQVPVSI